MSSTTLRLLLLALVVSCGGTKPSARRDAVANPRAELEPLGTLALRPLSDEPGLETRADPAGPATLKAGGRGAILGVGPAHAPEGKLWLRGGAEVRVGRRGEALALDVVRGEARLRLWSGRASVVAGPAGFAPLPADALVRRPNAAPLAVADVAREPAAAEWALALEEPPVPAGLGTLEARGPDGRLAALELRRVDVQVALAGDQAETRVEHVFYNASGDQLEGTFRFPLPDGAAVTGLAMEVNGRLMEGVLVEREKARRTYEKIVDSMQDPALLEWEEGQQFKLRVFPIEPGAEKRVVLTYVAPLHRGAAGWEYVYSTAAPEAQPRIAAFRLAVEGATIRDARDFAPGEEVVYDVPADRAPAAALLEQRADGTYLAVRVSPDWARLAPVDASAVVAPRRVVVVVDSSRSALEGKPLTLDVLRATLFELGDEDAFVVLACDISCRGGDAFVPATPAAVDAAVGELAALDFDGASDLAGALRRAGAVPGRTEILYIGDGTATWGDTAPAALRDVATNALGGVPLHALVVGKGASADVVAELCGVAGGRAAHPRSLVEARRFALELAASATAPRLRSARVTADGHEVYPTGETTLFPGDELLVLLRTPQGAAQPAELVLHGRLGDREVTETIRLPAPAPATHVARRWASARIAALDAEGGHDEEIVQLSLDYGVMTRKTSFLVLESEEAYRQHQIARREQEQADRAPQVSGADLESVDGREASLEPDQIQPGDPEIRVPAPADAREVAVIFPFGDTKLAVFEPELGAWTVRFLIDAATPDGRYEVLVRITHADGGIEELRLPYVVDTVAPEVRLTVTPAGENAWLVSASQVVADGAAPDLRFVELRLPDGRLLRLDAVGPGELQGTWESRTPLSGPQSLRVVAVDEALNRRVSEVTVELP